MLIVLYHRWGWLGAAHQELLAHQLREEDLTIPKGILKLLDRIDLQVFVTIVAAQRAVS